MRSDIYCKYPKILTRPSILSSRAIYSTSRDTIYHYTEECPFFGNSVFSDMSKTTGQSRGLVAYYSRYPVIARLTNNYTSSVVTEKSVSYTCTSKNLVANCFHFFRGRHQGKPETKIYLTSSPNERRNK